jgi:hypothetical protein
MLTFDLQGDMPSAVRSACEVYVSERLKGLRCADHSNSPLRLMCSQTSDTFQVDSVEACCEPFNKTITGILRGNS